ncbi:DNA primase large subunit-like [Liolophura sinensis]|uniref:DNA primase large subunit-like n=1 Tax=Liolophura sinensis TaxID=3198878 RepID=UPI0031582CC4
MDFSTKVNKSRSQRRIQKEGFSSYHASHNLQFYTLPPTEIISLQEFEDSAVERLKVLKAIETAGLKYPRSSEQYTELMDKELKNSRFKSATKVSGDADFQRLDHMSHFILRLVYCKSDDLRRWFLQQELDLFRYRFTKERSENIEAFLSANNLDYKPIAEEEKAAISLQLSKAGNISISRVDSTQYYKVPFTEVLDLVRAKKVYLEKGFAYVPKTDLVSIILSVYRTHLSHALAVTSRALPHLEEDGRLIPLLNRLSKCYVGQDYTTKKSSAGKITADMLDQLSKKSFPLCMQHLHQSVRQTHHLKHWGRLQYTLFMKGIGMALEEVLKFWRAEFCRIMDVDKFDKQYAYNFRHSFGKEGKRADYTPYNCMKIILTNPPAAGDCHGCPYRHIDTELLIQKLRNNGMSKDGIDQVMQYVKGGHYQMACTRTFELSHQVEPSSFSVQHPNQYFEESQALLNGTKTVVGTPQTPRTQRSNLYTQSTPSSQKSSQPVSSTQLSGIEEMEDDDFPQMSAEEVEAMTQEN